MDTVDSGQLVNSFEYWVNTFENISRPVRHLSELSDGIILFEIAADIDPKWFKLIRSADMGDNWVHKFNNLKKLYKLISRYLEEKLSQSLVTLDPPDLNTIAKDADTKEILKLCGLVIAVAVQCDNNQYYIQNIQTLPQYVQRNLMLSLEHTIAELNRGGAIGDSDNEDVSMDQELATLHQQRGELERRNQALVGELQNMKNKYEELMGEKEELKQRIRDLERASAQAAQSGKSDFLVRTEIDNLRYNLQKSEERRVEQEAIIEKQMKEIDDLSRAEAELSAKADEAVRLKDKLDEYKHAIDKLQKTENVIEKYKKKLEEGADYRRQMKVLEEQNQELLNRNKEVEQEYRKVLAFKSLMDSYKEQIMNLENKNSALAKDKNKVEYEASQQHQRLQQLEADRLRDNEQIQLLEEKVRELEFSGGQGVPLSNDLEMETEDMETSMLGRTTQNTELQLKISQLERELQSLREESQDDGGAKATVLQHLLDDANRLKAKYEQDYLEEHQAKIVLQGELDRIRAGKGDTEEHAQLLVKVKALEEESHTKEQLELKNKQLEEQLQQARDQVLQYSAKLQRAKEFIVHQDGRIKEGNQASQGSENYSEAIVSLKSELHIKEEEATALKRQLREMEIRVRREQLLMTSAWHDQQKRDIRENILSQHQKLAPTSWLGVQRRVFSAQLGVRH
ncbi:hypothetical protein BGX34_011940 [Mortierella sp. NVP85]|nr:hypothetical protein BGX34_011940 [Mortierella sp. NVP85]